MMHFTAEQLDVSVLIQNAYTGSSCKVLLMVRVKRQSIE